MRVSAAATSDFFRRSAKATADPASKRDNSTLIIEKRIVTELSICGYLTGDPSQPRTANTGFDCRVDTSHGLWGFCPTTVISAVDCGLGGACIDSYACSNGCGYTNNPSMTTWTCSESTEAFCSTALLTFGIDQTYSYIGCGRTAKTDHYFVSTTAAAVSSSSSAASVQASVPLTADPSSTSTTSLTSSSSSASGSISTSVSSPSSTTGSTIAATAKTGTPDTDPSNATRSGSSSSSTGPIIGGVIGGLVVICASVVLAIYLVKRDRSRKRMSCAGRKNAAVLPPEYSPKDPNTSRYSGWGPRELPASYPVEHVRSPVELPGYAM